MLRARYLYALSQAVENVEDDSSPIASIYELKTSHLTPAQADFFKQWEALITLEEQDSIRFRKELWTMSAQEREEKGRCFNSMVIDASFATPQGPPMGKPAVRGHSLLNGHLSIGDAITVSVDSELLALARGFIIDLTPEEVVLGLDHDLNANKIAARLRIDKDELSGGMGHIRDNLAQMFYADRDIKRVELVIDLWRPMFEDELDTLDALRWVPEYVDAVNKFNSGQLAAMTRVLSANDYALILGMPGTGKMTVIVALIRTFVGMGKTVLLMSYTHSVVHMILLKLKDDYGILRLGNVDKVHPDVRKFTQAERRMATTIEQLEHQLMSPPVVATTCVPDNIADMPGTASPPLVHNPAARKGSLETSLFRQLSKTHPHAVVDLTHQYRMNEDVMLLSNKLIYGDRLRCGSEAVATYLTEASLTVFRDGVAAGAVFVDTDCIPAFDSRVGDLVQNVVEGKLVYQITEALLWSGIEQRQIGIMSLYRQQIKLLSHLLQDKKDIKILTADNSQGQDKDCVVISMVRANDHGQRRLTWLIVCAHHGKVGELLKDWWRINVSFTRSQSKLVIIGSRKTPASVLGLAEFLELMDERQWLLVLPKRMESLHLGLAPLPM
ncbi:AAA domain-containing protein [Melanogaster broomeanus]|nr:AAA domain-containing protein [Melanogaster broomeanus]